MHHPSLSPARLPAPPPPQSVHNAMLALRKVVKRFEYKPKDARGPLHEIMNVTLPLLHTMSVQLLAEDSAEAGQVRRTRLFLFCFFVLFLQPAPRLFHSIPPLAPCTLCM